MSQYQTNLNFGVWPSLSVVMATLGDAQIARTISKMNSGSIRPSEILVCIPEEDAHRVEGLPFDNVRIVPTKVRGQVAQRAEGFQQVSCPLVMQLDDDVLLAYDTIEILVTSVLTLGRGHVVGPVFYNAITTEPISKIETGFKGFVINLYEVLVHGLPWGTRRMGALSKTGGCGSVDPRCCNEALIAVSWLPGGCSISFLEDLILDAFFPFDGKAFSEDILHSFLRAKNGTRHHVALAAKATIFPPERTVTRHSAFAEIRARRYVAKTLGGSSLGATIAAVLDIVRRQLAALLTR